MAPNKSAVGVIADNVDNKKEFSQCYAIITSSGFVTVNGAIGIHNDDNEIVNPSDEDLELLQQIMKYYFDNNCTNLVSRGLIGKIKNGEFVPNK